MKPLVIQTTFPKKGAAKKLAKILIKSKLAACVQIQKISSIYRWDDTICEDKEYSLHIKTKKENYKKIQRKIKENHSYDVPEIIAIQITKISQDYKKFLKENS